MDRGSASRNKSKENDSLGILCMDNLKAFGENSSNASITMNSGRISDRLNIERWKAFETLKKFDFQKTSNSSSNKENLKASTAYDHTPSASEKSNYVPYRQPKSINISDLVTDETIDLNDSTPSMSDSSRFGKENVSFEPNEITGRSTLYKGIPKNTKKSAAARLSVAEILASSVSRKARNLSETLRSDLTHDEYDVRSQSSRSSCSSFTYDALHSLPRTADLSISKVSLSDLSINGGEGISFTSSQVEHAKQIDERFAPSEMMMNKLILDEIAWAEEYAAIPTATLSKEAKEKANMIENNALKVFESTQPSASNSLVGEHNFSVGTFFNMRSDDIFNIVKSKSPDKCRTPIALVDEESTIGAGTATDIEATPKVDNKTYTKLQSAKVANSIKPMEEEDHESKDSGRDTQNSFLLSMSAIDRALCDLNIETDHSDAGVVQQVLSKAKKQKSPQIRIESAESKSPKATITSANTILDLLSENKENLDPAIMQRATLSDTLDFSESLLNATDLKKMQRSNNSPRSTLSPLNLSNNRLSAENIIAGNEADDDEWPSTPVKPPHRRVSRKKSPNDPPLASGLKPQTNTGVSSMEDKTPISRGQYTHPKSLSSTRLEGDKHASAECDFGVSPSLVQVGNNSPNVSVAVNGNVSTLAAAAAVVAAEVTPKIRKSALSVPNGGLLVNRGSLNSPTQYQTTSPMSSPRSGMSSPTVNGYHSPHLDSTTNSERRVLGAGTLMKAASSPVASESGNSNYGVESTRSYSSASNRNVNNVGGRSISRCSNSSEFSHRDGKIIPLKVTTLELSWGSTKLRTEVFKTMQVKNISNKRLVVRLEICGPGFQICKAANLQSSNLTLQSQECRSIKVCFCPTVTGAAVGILSFFSPHGTTTVNVPFLEIPLYGYGGHAFIMPLNMFKGPVGSPFMPMGDVHELFQPLEKSFEIFNRGPLLGFATVSIDCLGLSVPRLAESFEVSPSCMLIAPGKSVKVRVVFRPRREDIKKIIKKIQQVFTLANMRIICGDEANRQRVRRLLQRMSEEERLKISSSILDKLWGTFPNEVEISGFENFKENPEVVSDLITCMRDQEISLTINRDTMDDTIESSSIYFPDGDDTVLFRTICAASPVPPANSLERVDEVLETSLHAGSGNVISSSRDERESWSVVPNVLEIDLKGNQPIAPNCYKLYIRNNYKSRQYFEVACNCKNIFLITPNEGYVDPDGGQTQVEIRIINEFRLFQEYSKIDNICITVNIENERICVPVKALK